MRVKYRIRHTPFSEWRHYFGCVISFVTFGLILLSFVTPYWLQSWSRLHTPFLRLGLWEFCLKGFMERVDQGMVSYFDCWWILSPYYSKIFAELVPFWFIIIQVLMSVSLAIQVVLFVLLIVYLCERIRHVERRIFSINMMAVGHALTACALFPALVVFGVNWKNPNWMPYPKFNWPSWSYGAAILANFSSLCGALCFGLVSRELRRDLEEYTMEFPMSTKLKHRRRWWLRKRRWSQDVEAPGSKPHYEFEKRLTPTPRPDEMISMSEFSQSHAQSVSQQDNSLGSPESDSQPRSFESPSSSMREHRPLVGQRYGSDI
ncbi:hypothetical protein X801_07183 [Opisthorchis viverrini]|nr:hypothetical protein X801_07183 [Opisthorchis viverrini]